MEPKDRKERKKNDWKTNNIIECTIKLISFIFFLETLDGLNSELENMN